MIHFNLLGAGMLLGSALVGFAFGAFGASTKAYGTISLLVMTALDLLYRWRSSAMGHEKWLSYKTGGYLGLAPSWIMGIAMSILVQVGALN